MYNMESDKWWLDTTHLVKVKKTYKNYLEVGHHFIKQLLKDTKQSHKNYILIAYEFVDRFYFMIEDDMTIYQLRCWVSHDHAMIDWNKTNDTLDDWKGDYPIEI